ncbi:MAG: site-specific integrase [Steroidobacteraceae bacterium]
MERVLSNEIEPHRRLAKESRRLGGVARPEGFEPPTLRFEVAADTSAHALPNTPKLVLQWVRQSYTTPVPASNRPLLRCRDHSLVTPSDRKPSVPTLKLRQDLVRTLPHQGSSGKHQCIYWDQALECFGLRVYPSGRRVFVCAYRVNRRRRLAHLGRADVLTLDQARKKAIAYLGQAARQEDPQGDADTQRKLKTMEELCEAFIEGHLKKKHVGWKDNASALRRRVLPKLKSRLAATIGTADVEAIHSEVGVQYPYAANHLLEVIRKMFNWGRVAGLVPKDHANPAVGIVRFPERKRRRFITTVEMPQFIQSLEREDSDYARHGLWLLLLTGLRSTELLKAKWTDVDWDMGTLFIGLTKNGDPLLAPLSDAAIARLKMVPKMAHNPYIICGKKAGAHLTDLGEPLRRILRRAELENIRVHDLRRTVGSWLAQAGKSLHLIGEVLNHRDPKTTAGYAYFQTQQRRDALAGHGERVLALGAPHLRTTAEPTAISATTLLHTAETANPVTATPTIPACHRHYFRREELYKLVWTAPVSELATRLGVSDVALAKLCRRTAVPTPGRGYWARLEAGQPVTPSPLPPAPEGLPELLRIRGVQSL